MFLTTVEAEWVIGIALVRLKKVSLHELISTTKMNFEEFNPFPRTSDAAFARSFRPNGGQVLDALEPAEMDLVDEMARLRSDGGFRLENALQWMRVAYEDTTNAGPN